jgi:PAS domain S-box-containing protein
MDHVAATMNLLVLTSRPEEAEACISSLRTGGLAVRGSVLNEPGRLAAVVNGHSFDLILCCEYDPEIDLAACMESYRQLVGDIPLVIIASPDTDSASLIAAMRGGARDITERGDLDHLLLVVARELSDLGHRRAAAGAQRQLQESDQRIRDLLESSSECVAYIQEGVHVEANPAYARLFQFEGREDLDGIPLLDLIAPDQQSDMKRMLRQLGQLAEGDMQEVDAECVRGDGTRFHTRLRISRSNVNEEPCLQVIAADGTARTGGYGGSRIDADTGLPDRTALMGELATRLTGSAAAPFAAIYIGISAFADLIRSEGLTAGLGAVAEFGAALREVAPPGAFLARCGDAGFVLLASDLSYKEASELASSIGARVRSPLARRDPDKGPTLAAGLMLVEPGRDTPAAVLDTIHHYHLMGADDPGHASLRGKVGAATVGGASPAAGPEEEQLLTTQIDRALQGNGFELFYQPIVSLKGDSQENYSVLLRLREPDKTVREAKEFLPEAIQSGRMVAIDHWVVRQSIAEVATRRGQLHKINFFINISEQTLEEDKLLIWVCDYLREFQARGNWLTFQIIEEHARRQSAVLRRLVDGLRKVKCRVALNRFGLAPNPDMLLKGLPVDFVKFAPELGQGLADDEQKHRRLLELTKMVREAGAKTVVTGVEDARSLTLLWTAGVDYVQGNFLQKPTDTIDIQASGR